jgi:V/A-type H+-transporting ATPase subunit I
MYDNLNALFLEASRTADYVYGCYIVANGEASKADSAFKSLHFEHIALGDLVANNPSDSYTALAKALANLNGKISGLKSEAAKLLDSNASKILGCCDRLDDLSSSFDVRKLAARVESEEEIYSTFKNIIDKQIESLGENVNADRFSRRHQNKRFQALVEKYLDTGKSKE